MKMLLLFVGTSEIQNYWKALFVFVFYESLWFEQQKHLENEKFFYESLYFNNETVRGNTSGMAVSHNFQVSRETLLRSSLFGVVDRIALWKWHSQMLNSFENLCDNNSQQEWVNRNFL